VAELPVDEKKELDRVPHPGWLGFSPDGKWLAARLKVTDAADRVRVWATDGWKSDHWPVPEPGWGRDKFKSCAFAADSRTLYALGCQRLYAGSLPPTGKPAASRMTLGKPDEDLGHAAALGADGKALLVATAFGGSFRLDLVPPADPRAFRQVFEAKVKAEITAFAVSRDGGLCALGSDAPPDEPEQYVHALEVWETAPPKQRFRHQVPEGYFSAVAFDPKGAVVGTGNSDGTFRVWDAKSGRILSARDEDAMVLSVDFHPTRALLVYSTGANDRDANCRVVEVPSGKLVASWSADRHGVRLARFSPDGKWVATVGGECVVRVWAVKDLVGE
jgi:hypothetical protein